MFKIGRLALRNGEFNWKNYKEILTRNNGEKVEALSAARFS